MPGRLIVFEGGEGAGKTTQLKRSHQWLQDSGWLARLQAAGQIHQAVITREPGGTTLCQNIRQLLLHPAWEDGIEEQLYPTTELLLYAADRAQHVTGFLRPCLAAGDLIFCDRYCDSTIAYQGYGRGLDLSLIAQLNQIATAGLESDLTLWLDLDVATGLHRTQQRGSRDRMEQAEVAFHQRIRAGFGQLAQQCPQRIVKIDANQSEDQVAAQIQGVLQQRLGDWYG
jgi:dTMP kinase